MISFIDTVFNTAATDNKIKYRITHADTTYEDVELSVITPVTTQGTALNKAFFDTIDSYLVPTGTIVMWSGAINSIPTGWALCNGSNGTPDLRDRFIVGAGNSYNVGATGGEATHTLTINELPAHSHTYSVRENAQRAAGSTSQNYYTVKQAAATSNTSSVGGGAAHENRPPYYALAYIMKK